MLNHLVQYSAIESFLSTLSDNGIRAKPANGLGMRDVGGGMMCLLRGYIAALCRTGLATAAAGQDNTQIFRAATKLAPLEVQVIHRKTATATAALRRKDLQVGEDGKPQQITFFSRDELPLSIVMLFDMTATSQAVLKRLAEGARSALTHLKRGDEVAVMVYAAHGRVIDGFTTDRDAPPG
jgi:hypothetical protein